VKTANERTVALNLWKEAHVLPGTFTCHIKHIGDVDPLWQARAFNDPHCEKIVALTIEQKTVSEHVMMLATAESKHEESFDFDLAQDEKDLKPMLGNHCKVGLERIMRRFQDSEHSVGLHKCYEKVTFQVCYVDTDVQNLFFFVFVCVCVVLHVQTLRSGSKRKGLGEHGSFYRPS